MSLFQFYSYIDGSLHVSGPQAHLQENSHSCSHNHWFSIRTVLVQNTRPERYEYWTNGCGNSCVNSPEDGLVRRYMNKIETVTSVGFSFLIFSSVLKYRWSFTHWGATGQVTPSKETWIVTFCSCYFMPSLQMWWQILQWQEGVSWMHQLEARWTSGHQSICLHTRILKFFDIALLCSVYSLPTGILSGYPDWGFSLLIPQL